MSLKELLEHLCYDVDQMTIKEYGIAKDVYKHLRKEIKELEEKAWKYDDLCK